MLLSSSSHWMTLFCLSTRAVKKHVKKKLDSACISTVVQLVTVNKNSCEDVSKTSSASQAYLSVHQSNKLVW